MFVFSPALPSTRVLTRTVILFPLESIFFYLSAGLLMPPLASALLPSPPAGLLLFFPLRSGTLLFPLLSRQPFYFCPLPPSSPPPRTCVQTPLADVFAPRLLFLGRTRTWTHFSVVTYPRLVILAHYDYAVLYKHLNENLWAAVFIGRARVPLCVPCVPLAGFGAPTR